MTTPVRHGADLERIRRLARVLDTAFRIPGTNIRFGLDAILGLIPGIGDLSGLAFGGAIVAAAARLGAPRNVIVRMLLNVGLDALIGTIPILGDLFDVGYRANARNVALLEQSVLDPLGASRSATRSIGVLIGGALLLILALVGGAIWLIAEVVERIGW